MSWFARKSKTSESDPYGLPSHADVDTQVHRSSVRYDQLADPHSDDRRGPSRRASDAAPRADASLADGAPVAIPVDASPAAAVFVEAATNSLLTSVISNATPTDLPPRLSADATRAAAVSVASTRSGMESAPGSFVSASSVPKKMSSRAAPFAASDDGASAGAAAAAAATADPNGGAIRLGIAGASSDAAVAAAGGDPNAATAGLAPGHVSSRSARRLLRPFKRLNQLNLVLFFALLLGLIVLLVVSVTSVYIATAAGCVFVLNAVTIIAFYCRVPVPADEPDEEAEEEEDHNVHPNARPEAADALLPGASGGAADDGGEAGAEVAAAAAAQREAAAKIAASRGSPRASASVSASASGGVDRSGSDAKSPASAAAAAAAAAGTPAEAAAAPEADDAYDSGPGTPDSMASGTSAVGGMGYGAIHLVRRHALAERDRLQKLRRLDRKARKRVHKQLVFYTTFAALVALIGLGRHYIFNG